MDNKIKTFIFDFYGVICTPILDCWYQEHRLNNGFVDKNFKKVLKQNDLGVINWGDVADYFSKYEGVNSSKEKIEKEINNYLKLNYSLIEIIKNLKQKGFKMVLLTNANASYFEKEIYKRYTDFKSLFDEIIISSSVKMVKPNSDIFLYTLMKTNSVANESVFIDDSQENVDAATRLGINGFLYTDNASFVNYIKKIGIDLSD